VHVKVTMVRHGKRTYRYLSLVESYRDQGKVRQRVVARLGEVDAMAASGELDRIIDSLGATVGRRAQSLSVEAAPAFGSIAACYEYFVRLGLVELFENLGRKRRQSKLADAVFTMLANRLVEPSSKRRAVSDWLEADVALPETVTVPSLDQCYRALDVICDTKDSIESHLYAALTDLTNLDLRLVCYDLTSTYFETSTGPSAVFPSRAFGYSRDHRSDRPQIVIGLLVTGDGIPIAHQVFAGNTADISTLPGVLADLQARFGVGKIALVADRGLISEANLEAVGAAGFEHVLATRLHRDHEVTVVLDAAGREATIWVPVDTAGTTAADITHDAKRYVVISSPARKTRDDARLQQLLARTEDALISLAGRVSAGRLKDPAKISVAADRILRDSGVARCFTTHVRAGAFAWDYDHNALRYETELLAGRYVIATSLDPPTADTATVVAHYKTLQTVERRFRVLKDFLALRPVYHWTEKRVRGHVALCVLAAVIEALIGKDLAAAGLEDPDLANQTLTPRRALRELSRVRAINLASDNGATRRVITRPGPLHTDILAALGVDTSHWNTRVT
jgi:transposase